MNLTPLTIEISRLESVLEREAAPRSAHSAGKSYNDAERRRRRIQPVAAVVMAQAAERYQGCSCEKHGLYAGMPIDKMLTLRGCQTRFVCPRLDAIRRHYGF